MVNWCKYSEFRLSDFSDFNIENKIRMILDGNFINELERLVKQTGLFIKEQKGNVTLEQVDVKSHNSFVTFVDKKAEKLLVDNLSKLIPNSGFIAEEGTASETDSDYRWIVDPLDGTTNFIHDIYPVSVSVALQFKKETIAGLVYEIGNDELFTAYQGKGAFLNGKSINVSITSKLENAFLGTGFPYYDYDRIKGFMNVLSEFMQKTQGIRRPGSAATDLAYVACGRFDGFFEYSLSPWDVAAGAFIVEQAGGVVVDFKGGDDYLFGKEIIASNKKILLSLLNEIRKYM